jgi:hypothetical protein
MLFVATLAQATHEPTVPYIPVTRQIYERGAPITYQITTIGGVPAEYKKVVHDGVKEWITNLKTLEPAGNWNIKVGVLEGQPEWVFRLVYDAAASSSKCAKVLNHSTTSSSSDTTKGYEAYGVTANADGFPVPEERRIHVFPIYVGCADFYFSTTEIKKSAMHIVGHALGLGTAVKTDKSIMCHDVKCVRPDKPTSLDLRCIIALYGTDGFAVPQTHIRPVFCT